MAVGILNTALSLSPSTWGILIGVFLLVHITTSQYRSWRQLSHVPGPWIAGFTPLWLTKQSLSGRYAYRLKLAHLKWGPYVRIGPRHVICTEPEVIRKMSAVRSQYLRGDFYLGVKVTPEDENIFSLIDEDKHRRLKSKMGLSYSGVENQGSSFELQIDTQIASFISLIERKYISTATQHRPIEFSHRTSFLALDIIGTVGLGEPFGFLKNDADMYDFMKLNDAFVPYSIAMTTLPWIVLWLQSWPLSKLLPNEKDKAGWGKFVLHAIEYVDKNLMPGTKVPKCMLGGLIKAGLTRKELIDEVTLEMIAGTDSTAAAMRITTLLLLSRPSSLIKLRNEIDTGISQGKISSPIKNSEAQSLPYLQAVIRESIRVFPPVASPLSKEVPEGGDTIGGYFLPAGTQVGHNTLGMMHRKDIWGEDGDVFRPERWLEMDTEEYKEKTGITDLVFGYGRFQCLGKTIASMELNKVFVELLRRYDLQILNPTNPLDLYDAGFWVTKEFWINISHREDLPGPR